jgi:hypothetical protein
MAAGRVITFAISNPVALSPILLVNLASYSVQYKTQVCVKQLNKMQDSNNTLPMSPEDEMEAKIIKRLQKTIVIKKTK